MGQLFVDRKEEAIDAGSAPEEAANDSRASVSVGECEDKTEGQGSQEGLGAVERHRQPAGQLQLHLHEKEYL